MKIGKLELNKLELISISAAIGIMLPMLAGMALRAQYFTEAGFPGQGWVMMINDPGKIFFHIVVLPIIVYALVKFAPYRAFKAIIQRKEAFYPALVVVIFLVYTMLSITLNDLHDGFCKRNPTPDNFNDPGIRKDLVTNWVNNHDILHDSLINEKASSELYKELDASYVNVCQHYVHSRCTYTRAKSFFIGPAIGSCNYFRMSSISSNLDGLLTFLTLLCGVFLLITLFVHIFNRKEPKLQQISALKTILVLALLWLPLRWYSEWYINFGDIGEGSLHYSNKNPEVVMALLFFALLAWLTYESTKKKQWAAIGCDRLLLIISAIQAAFIILVKSELLDFDSISGSFFKHEDNTQLVISIIFMAFVVILITIVIKDTIIAIANIVKTILFVSSIPADQTKINFIDEFNTIKKSLDTHKNNAYKIEVEFNSTRENFVKKLNEYKPAILHLAMHGEKGRGVYFQSEYGEAIPVSADDFAIILEKMDNEDRPETIIFSACHSLEVAEKSKKYCSHAVGTKDFIPDPATPVYAYHFYRLLFGNISNNIARCHEAGVWGISIKDPPFPPVNNIPVHEIFALVR